MSSQFSKHLNHNNANNNQKDQNVKNSKFEKKSQILQKSDPKLSEYLKVIHSKLSTECSREDLASMVMILGEKIIALESTVSKSSALNLELTRELRELQLRAMQLEFSNNNFSEKIQKNYPENDDKNKNSNNNISNFLTVENENNFNSTGEVRLEVLDIFKKATSGKTETNWKTF